VHLSVDSDPDYKEKHCPIEQPWRDLQPIQWLDVVMLKVFDAVPVIVTDTHRHV
jgi:hypothetical protein